MVTLTPTSVLDNALQEVTDHTHSVQMELPINDLDQLGDTLEADKVVDVFRPIQYLGSKLRSLQSIVSLVEAIKPRQEVVLDLFAGTTVVSQALAHSGFRAIATDAMSFSTVFAHALLGIDRSHEDVDVTALLAHLIPPPEPTLMQVALEQWLTLEADALAQRDSNALLEISQSVPQIWRPQGASRLQEKQFADLARASGRAAFDISGIISTHYAGTYFGIAQAAEIDRLRMSIQALRQATIIGSWEENVLLTALLSVASDCAFSPGKHFAQPHRIDSTKDLTFLRQRILQDRGINIWVAFQDRLRTVLHYAFPANSIHQVHHATLESLIASPSTLGDVDMIYADPPYTAQQYSRFYHVPETIVKYQVPHLQDHRGRVTQGLYPTDRYKSRFCSKRAAPQAFRDLFVLARQLSSSLLISYSGSSTGHTGNDRMISLDELVHLCRSAFNIKQVQVIELSHEYRQFNHRNVAVAGRLDKEFLILCDCSC